MKSKGKAMLAPLGKRAVPPVILRNEMTTNLDLGSGKRTKGEILHFVQNDRRKAGG